MNDAVGLDAERVAILEAVPALLASRSADRERLAQELLGRSVPFVLAAAFGMAEQPGVARTHPEAVARIRQLRSAAQARRATFASKRTAYEAACTDPLWDLPDQE